MDTSPQDIRSIVRDLADGFSNQSRSSNRLWLSSVAAAAVLVFPDTSSGIVTLPFRLGKIPESVFEPVGFGILFVLFMAFCQAYAHAHDAGLFGQRLLDEFERSNPKVHAREFYDILLVSAFARAWPLAGLLRHLFRGIPPKITAAYYIVLKLLTHGTMLAIPLSALLLAYLHILKSSPPWIHMPALIGLLLVAIAVIEVVVAEFRYTQRVLANSQERENHNGTA